MKHLAILVSGTLAFSLPVLLPRSPAANPKLVPAVNLSVNTAADEDDPYVAGNGLVLYYAANAKGKWDIMVSRRTKTSDRWGPGEVLQDYIQTEVDDRSVCATAEGRFPQYLYYASKTDKSSKGFDLYVAVKQGKDKAFTEPRALTTVDTEDADEMHPWLSADGKELYFSCKTKEGWRVFVARRASAAGPVGFGDPVMLEDLPPGFHHATLMPDGSKMYLQGPLENGRWGLFVSTSSRKGWGKPELLDMLNDPEAPTGDRSPALSRDGFRLYFASDRKGGKGGLDLWMVETYLLRKR
jgi:Tol biopolymer transport system component